MVEIILIEYKLIIYRLKYLLDKNSNEKMQEHVSEILWRKKM